MEIEGKPAIKPFWQVSDAEMTRCLEATSGARGSLNISARRLVKHDFLTRGGMPVTMSRLNLGTPGLGPALQLAKATSLTCPDDVPWPGGTRSALTRAGPRKPPAFVAAIHASRSLPGMCTFGDEHFGAPRRIEGRLCYGM